MEICDCGKIEHGRHHADCPALKCSPKTQKKETGTNLIDLSKKKYTITHNSHPLKIKSQNKIKQSNTQKTNQTNENKKPKINISWNFFGTKNKVSFDSKLDFTVQLAFLLDAGIPVEKALSMIGESMADKKMAQISRGICDLIREGGTLSGSMSSYPEVFDEAYINSVAAGEASGKMAEMLTRFAENLEKQRKIENKVKGALTYPIIVGVIALTILVFLMTFIVPKFADIFADILNGKPLPAITQVVMSISSFMVGHWFLLIVIVAFVWLGLIYAAKTEKGKIVIDKLLLRNPIFGEFMRKVYVSRFFRSMSTLLGSGVQILDALNISKRSTGNSVFGAHIQTIHDAVKEGEEMHNAMSKDVFSSTDIGVIRMGQESGKMPKCMNKMAERYDSDIDKTVASITSVIEPIMIVFLAFIVGTIVLAIFLPMMELLKGMQ